MFKVGDIVTYCRPGEVKNNSPVTASYASKWCNVRGVLNNIRGESGEVKWEGREDTHGVTLHNLRLYTKPVSGMCTRMSTEVKVEPTLREYIRDSEQFKGEGLGVAAVKPALETYTREQLARRKTIKWREAMNADARRLATEQRCARGYFQGREVIFTSDPPLTHHLGLAYLDLT